MIFNTNITTPEVSYEEQLIEFNKRDNITLEEMSKGLIAQTITVGAIFAAGIGISIYDKIKARKSNNASKARKDMLNDPVVTNRTTLIKKSILDSAKKLSQFGIDIYAEPSKKYEQAWDTNDIMQVFRIGSVPLVNVLKGNKKQLDRFTSYLNSPKIVDGDPIIASMLDSIILFVDKIIKKHCIIEIDGKKPNKVILEHDSKGWYGYSVSVGYYFDDCRVEIELADSEFIKLLETHSYGKDFEWDWINSNEAIQREEDDESPINTWSKDMKLGINVNIFHTLNK